MKTWIDVYDSNYNRLGNGPVTSVIDVQFKSILDSAGYFEIVASLVDSKASELFQAGNYIRAYSNTLIATTQFLGEGIIQNKEIIENNDVIQIKITGSDTLQELNQKVVFVHQHYSTTLANVLDDLFNRIPEWSYTLDSSLLNLNVQGLYSGVSIFGILQDLASKYGFHFRLSEPRVLSIGLFGDVVLPRITKVDVITTETIYSNDLIIAQTLSQHKDTNRLYNWLVPVGANGVVTLEHSTRTSPYEIKSLESPNGDVFYYISDDDSIASYGQVEKAKEFVHINPNSRESIVEASNALYDSAVEDLNRNCSAIEYYKVRVLNLQDTVFVGDKARLDYKAQIWTEENFNEYINIQDEFWILDVVYHVSNAGTFADLTISKNPYAIETPARYIVNSIKHLSQQRPHKSTYTRTYSHSSPINSSYNMDIDIAFSKYVFDIREASLQLKTSHLMGLTDYPADISISIDDTIVESNIDIAGDGVNQTIDLTAHLSLGDHTLTIACGSGEGYVQAQLDIVETTYAN